jgi:regulatory protein
VIGEVNEMAIITKITTQKKNLDRFNVFMDYGKGEEYAFSVDSDVLIKFQLKKGMQLDDFSFLEIQYQDDVRKAYNNAVSFLARRMRSKKEIKDYLLKKEWEDPVINEVLHKLTAHRYINDQEFALAFVRTLANTTDKGPDLINLELKEKGIDGEIRTEALREFPLEQQIEKAVKITDKFFQKSGKESIKIQKQKLEQQLLRKGYPFEVIQIAINEVDIEKEEDEEMNAVRFQGEKAHRKYSHLAGYEYQQKMKQALYRKGFSMDYIERFLDEIEKS